MADSPSTPADLTATERADIEGMSLLVETGTLYQLLGVRDNVDRRAIRDAYFKLSKQFHPDAFYGRNLGPMRDRLDAVFRALTNAYDVLSNKNNRAEYDRSLGLDPARALVATPVEAPRADATGPVRTASSSTQPAVQVPRTVSTASQPAISAQSDPLRTTGAFTPVRTAVDPLRTTGATEPLRPAEPPRPAEPARSTPQSDPSRAPDPLRTTGQTTGPVRPMEPLRSTGQNAPVRPGEDPLRTTGQNAPVRPASTFPAARTTGTHAPLTGSTSVSNPSMPAVQPSEEAQRAAREALARKLAGGRTLSQSTMPAVQPGAVSAGAALQAQFANREDLAQKNKLDALRRTALELANKGDLLGASNTMQIAVSLAPEDATVKSEAFDIQRKLLIQLAPQNTEAAREAERSKAFDRAAALWSKVVSARPDDFEANFRLGRCLLAIGRELPRAAEAARRAINIAPRRIDGHVLLAEIFEAAGKPASAKAALEQAAKLDPTSLAVKDLLARLR